MGDPLELLGAIEDYVARAVAPMQKRIAQLEAERARIPERGEKGEPGAAADVDYDRVEEVALRLVQKEFGKYPVPKDGRDGRDGTNGTDGAAGVNGKDGAAGVDGKDADIAPAIHNLELRFVALKGDLERIVKELPLPQGERGEQGLAGKDADEDAIVARVTARALAAIPVPKDGVAGKDGRDGIDGKDGVDGVGLSGKDGAPGTDGRDGQRGPEGPEGLRGEPGRDALDGLAAIEASLRGERTLALDFLMTGGARKSFEFRLPIPIYRGKHEDGWKCERGDAVTRDGSTWIAVKDTDSTPPSADWILAVKKGRDLR